MLFMLGGRHVVRGDDQQPRQVGRQQHVLELGRPEDLHRLRGRRCYRRLGGWQPHLGQRAKGPNAEPRRGETLRHVEVER